MVGAKSLEQLMTLSAYAISIWSTQICLAKLPQSGKQEIKKAI